MNLSEITVSNKDLTLYYTPAQMDIFFGPHTERYRTVHKGRRFGITTSACNFAIEALLDNQSCLWVDTIQVNLDGVYRRYLLPVLRQIQGKFWNYRQQHHDLSMFNAVMDMRSAERPENIEGFAYKFIIINEAGHCLRGQRGRELWYNTLYPMVLDYNASVYFLGTPKGIKAIKGEDSENDTSLFYELACKGGLDGSPKEKDWKDFCYSTYDNPLLSPELIKELEDDIPLHVRDQEIRGKFIEATGEPVFSQAWFPVEYKLPDYSLWRRKIVSIDTAFKSGAENDSSAGICVLETTVGYFILDMFCEKLEFPELLQKTKEFIALHGPDFVLIEDAASGQSLIQTIKKDIPILRPIKVSRDKISRATSSIIPFKDHKVYMQFGHWNKAYKNQLCSFNNRLDTEDDLVDCTSMAFNWFIQNSRSATGSTSVVSRKVVRQSSELARY
jgi:predicted phage terminase large subunit-like protein